MKSTTHGIYHQQHQHLKRYLGKVSEYLRVQTAAVQRFSEECGNSDILSEIAEKRKALKIDYITGDLDNLIKESLEGAERVKKIVQDLKNFSRVDESEFKTADINSGLESTINIASNSSSTRRRSSRNMEISL